MTYKKLGTRLFYKFSTEQMVEVMNMAYSSYIHITSNEMSIEVALEHSKLKDSTEEEFNAAKSEAMKRLNEERI